MFGKPLSSSGNVLLSSQPPFRILRTKKSFRFPNLFYCSTLPALPALSWPEVPVIPPETAFLKLWGTFQARAGLHVRKDWSAGTRGRGVGEEGTKGPRLQGIKGKSKRR